MKKGLYTGDLAKIVDVNVDLFEAVVKIVPRLEKIDENNQKVVEETKEDDYEEEDEEKKKEKEKEMEKEKKKKIK